MRPTVAVVAADEPETAAKSAQPKILACNSRPGRRVVSGARPENMSDDSRERKRISPIQMNIGSAVRSQMLSAPQTLVAKTSSTGAEDAISIAASPTAMSAKPTHNPSARQPKRIATRTSARVSMPIGAPLLRRFGAAVTGRLPAQQRHQFIHQCRRQKCQPGHHHRLRDPEGEFRHAEAYRVEGIAVARLHECA